jgi:predicted Rossmann-fold nucleotide-binding protein
MPLRRVVLLGGDSEPPEFRDAIEGLRQALSRQGIGIVAREGDGVIALPGALPALEGLFDHLGDTDAPCGLLDADRYYSTLLQIANDDAMNRLIRETQRGRVILERDPAALIQAMAEYRPPESRRGPGVGA